MDVSCGTSSNSGSSISSPAPSPRDPSPDQIITNHNSGSLQYADLESSSKTGMKGMSTPAFKPCHIMGEFATFV
ncbi:hypothetical protein SK128_017294 [Halocaridina rubra]|uniref:Uncharacterized protein n=1 Tax=Halocaridina rubra TaxID=373956 RepID=A0AAN8X7Q8_HALRR